MQTLNNPILTLFTLAAFIALAWYSLPVPEGYSLSDIAEVNRIVASSHTLTRQQRANRDITNLYGEGN